MNRRQLVGAAVGGALALWAGWGLYARRSTDRVAYETVARFDGVEVRAYPEQTVVTTHAPTRGVAFRRLFRYIDGANVSRAEIPMTAPVATTSETVRTTAPVSVGETDEGVRMSFYLPPGYAAATAPTPTDSNVVVASEPAGRLAVRRFVGPATARRVASQTETLLSQAAGRGLTVTGEPFLLRYSDPFTPPFMRETEVAVPVA